MTDPAIALHPRDALLGSRVNVSQLPVCDHYSGTEARMRKSLALQAEMTEAFGTCVFDVTLDCEDGARIGGEADHAALVASLAVGAPAAARIAVRVHASDHPAFVSDVMAAVAPARQRLTHVMLPKIDSPEDIDRACGVLDSAGCSTLPVHVLIESPGAVARAFAIAAHPRVESLSFGLMDFVSAHGGAIPASAMQIAGQFSHPLVLRAKLEIAAACHAHAKVPSHGVVTEFNDLGAVAGAARRAATELGYSRMWSIHPGQIRPIIEAFMPEEAEIGNAVRIVAAGEAANWAPVDVAGQLHDRASYRYFWQVLERAHRTGRQLPSSIARWLLPSDPPISHPV